MLNESLEELIDNRLGQKIIDEINKFSPRKYAVANNQGEILAKTNDFSAKKDSLDIKGKKALPLLLDYKPIGYLLIDENLGVIRENGRVIRSMAELIIHETYYKDVLTSDERRFDQLMYDFLHLEGLDLAEFTRLAESFGFDVEKNRLSIFVEIDDSNYLLLDDKEVLEGERERKIARIKREINTALNSFYTHHKENIVSYIGGTNFVIFKDMGGDAVGYQDEFKKTLNTLFYNLQNELRSKLTVGVGEYKPGLHGLRESFDEAKTALKFGKQIWGEGQIYHYDSFGVVAPLYSGVTEENISFSKNIIDSLGKHPELLESLKIYFETDLSLSKTAKLVKIHRNTLVYRLERISEITGFDPRVFNEAFQLQLALILNRYSEAKK